MVKDEHFIKRHELVNVKDILEEKIGAESFLKYEEAGNRAENLEENDCPMYVVVELNDYCNMRCKMCIKSIDANANGNSNMPLDMVEKLIKDCKDINMPSFFVGGGTECLINPDIRNVLDMIIKDGGAIDNVLITNGYELNQEMADFLIDNNWEKLFVSLDAATDETYKSIRGKDLSVVEKNLRYIIEEKKKRNSKFPIIRVSFVVQDENEEEIEDFYKKWKDDVEIIDFQNLIDFSDMDVIKDLPDTDEKCTAPFSLLMVDCKGDIYPCCNEWSKMLKIGNITEMTIKEAWESDIIKTLRNQIKNGKLNDICKNCLRTTKKVEE